jgi:hypothetical protein
VRRSVVLLLLIVILLAVLGLRQWVVNWHPVLSGQPGALLYVATFDDFVDEWQQYQGRLEAQVIGQALQLGVDAVRSAPYSAAKPYFADFDLQVEARAIGGPVNNGYGVVFRLQDPDNQYMFLVSSDGYYQVRRKVQGIEKELSTWIASPLVNQGLGTTNHLRVVGTADRFRFYINGQPVQLCVPNNPEGVSTYSLDQCIEGTMVDTLVDDAISSGHLGVVAQSLDEPGVVVDFDNFVVFAPQPAEVQT